MYYSLANWLELPCHCIRFFRNTRMAATSMPSRVSSCFQDKSQDWNTGYNEAQNDYRDGKPSSPHVAGEDYHEGYSQGYIDARNGSYRLC